MMEIFYKGDIYSYRTTDKVVGGMVATFTGDREVSICTDKTIPIGFFTLDNKDSEVYANNSVCVLVGQGEFRTDIFEKSEYRYNDFLYCSSKGKITNERKYKGNIIIGIVNYVSEDKIGLITCLARGLER